MINSRTRAFAIGAAALPGLLAAGCAPNHRPAVARSPPPVAVNARLELTPLGLSPDGEVRLLVRLRYADRDGRPAHVPAGGHVDVHASRGDVQWQPRARYGDPAAIVRLTVAGPLALRVTSDLARLPRVLRATTDTRAWRLPPVTARALGPHAVVVGWFPRATTGTVRIERIGGDGRRRRIALVAAPGSTFCDTSARPGGHETYLVARPGADPIEVAVDLPPELPASQLAVMRGKAMWLSFDDGVTRWDVDAMLDRAQRAGLRAIELRLAYGEFELITAARRATLDAFLDGAARRGIAIVGWTVPRALTFEDLAANVDVAAYRTADGHGISGLAVDLERGAEFFDVRDPQALAGYVARLRAAVGPRVMLVATVEDPYLERLDDRAIAYAAIAAQVDVMQPMTYWRARAEGASMAGMRQLLGRSYRRLRRLLGGRIPIDIGGQTASLGNRFGAPPAAEIAASLATARDLGAIGEAFFDWDGTPLESWAVLAASPWQP